MISFQFVRAAMNWLMAAKLSNETVNLSVLKYIKMIVLLQKKIFGDGDAINHWFAWVTRPRAEIMGESLHAL